jgi:catechol 2,3-dioxygenase
LKTALSNILQVVRIPCYSLDRLIRRGTMTYKPRYLGHVNLFVRDVEVSETFYVGLLGLHTYERRPGRAVFMSADLEQSHEIALIQLGPDAAGPDSNRVGLNHIAWRMESFEDLKELYARLKERGLETRVADHSVSLGIYFRDPDGNGNEVYYELPRDEWARQEQIFEGGGFPWSLDDEPAGAKAT